MMGHMGLEMFSNTIIAQRMRNLDAYERGIGSTERS